MTEEILTLKGKGLVSVTSLHNICPLPDGLDPAGASPDFYSLTSPDEDERRLAISATENTIEYARRFGARAVIVHLGRVEMRDRTRELAEAFGDRPRYEAVRTAMLKEREEKKGPYFDNALRSLEGLVGFAAAKKVALAIENRYYHREIPSPAEFDVIFRRFGPGGLYYWHDVGHAEVHERLGFDSHEELLQRFAGRLMGVHFHDIINLIEDHRAPLCGTFDFGRLIPYVKGDTIKVIEAHSPATADEIRRAKAHLERLFGAE
jgi:sugar phosphate isomerase/epimerase